LWFARFAGDFEPQGVYDLTADEGSASAAGGDQHYNLGAPSSEPEANLSHYDLGHDHTAASFEENSSYMEIGSMPAPPAPPLQIFQPVAASDGTANAKAVKGKRAKKNRKGAGGAGLLDEAEESPYSLGTTSI